MGFEFDINYIPVIVGGAIYFLIGSVWYANQVLGKRWQHELKLPAEEVKGSNMTIMMLGGLVMVMLQSMMIALVIRGIGVSGWASGASVGLLMAALTAIPALAVNYIYQLRSLTLLAIDSGYILVGYLAVGMLLGVWQ